MTTATSAATALPAPAPRRAPRPAEHEQRLHAVDVRARRRRPRIVYALVAIAGVLAIGAAQMTLSILTTEDSFAMAKLTDQQRSLTLQKQVLYDDVAGLSSPQNLASKASALGMVVGEPPAYMRLSDGALLGSGAASSWISSVDPATRGSVPNALLDKNPLGTASAGTAGAQPADGAATDAATGATPPADPATPPALTDGLPSPSTH